MTCGKKGKTHRGDIVMGPLLVFTCGKRENMTGGKKG